MSKRREQTEVIRQKENEEDVCLKKNAETGRGRGGANTSIFEAEREASSG